jgi:hypothetical protein
MNDILPDFIGQRIVSKGVRIINPCLRGEETATRDPVVAFPASIDNAQCDIISFEYQQSVSMCRRRIEKALNWSKHKEAEYGPYL